VTQGARGKETAVVQLAIQQLRERRVLEPIHKKGKGPRLREWGPQGKTVALGAIMWGGTVGKNAQQGQVMFGVGVYKKNRGKCQNGHRGGLGGKKPWGVEKKKPKRRTSKSTSPGGEPAKN